MSVTDTEGTTDKRHTNLAPSRSGWSKPAPNQRISFGTPISRALPEAVEMLSAHHVVVVTTRSLAGPDGLAEAVRAALGSVGISTISGIRAHTPREDVIRLTRELSHADGVVTIGGGSVCDAVKAARLCLANGVTEAAEMDRLCSHRASDGAALPVISPSLPFIAIPTTLSAAEFTSLAGVTDERGPRKEGYDYTGMAPNIVVLDPAMTIGTPSRLWFGTGMRAIDHAVETWCSVNATPLSDASSLYAARILIHALERTQRDSDDLQARQDCLEGAWLSIQGASAGVSAGASHGIGHALGGTARMPHGETSCVMLPHVLRYNAAVNAERQQELGTLIGETGRDLADVIAQLVTSLGLPGRLRDAGVDASLLGAVAAAAMHDPLLATNPLPITSEDEVLKLLKNAW